MLNQFLNLHLSAKRTPRNVDCSSTLWVCAAAARASSFASSSSHLHASTRAAPAGAPGLNLFFLMAHNCSVDVYFLISSDITGAPVIKHGRLEEKSASGKRGGEQGGREQRQRAQTGGLRAEEEIKKEVDTLSGSLRHVGRAVTGNVTRLGITPDARRKTTLSVGTVSLKETVSAKSSWKSVRNQSIHWKLKRFTKTVS